MMRRVGLAVVAALALCATGASVAGGAYKPSVRVLAKGLDNPRGLAFGPNGALYVAEGGTGGATSTVGLCRQVPAPVGPYTGGATGRISRVDLAGHRSTVVAGLPSSQTAAASGGLVSGVAAVAFLHGHLYALVSGAGCSHGVPGTPNEIVRAIGNGRVRRVADLSAFYRTHAVRHPEPDDYEPDGTAYSMVAYRGALYVVEPNHGEVDRVTPAGRITRVVDVSRSQGHIVPTAIAESRGVLYLGNLGTFPVRPHTERVLRLAGGRRLRTVARRLTAVVGLAFHRGHLYVLESTTRPGLPTRPGSGKVVELLPNGRQQLIAFDFDFPTAMTFGPDGALYVANRGFGFPAGFGEIVRIGVR